MIKRTITIRGTEWPDPEIRYEDCETEEERKDYLRNMVRLFVGGTD